MDLRVDDRPDPVVELGRLHDLYFLPPAPENILPFRAHVARLARGAVPSAHEYCCRNPSC